ncbi:jg6251 [Pararge aegeria aegeria]|uniref:Jg6251 protein n=1 Tax=Pararge aegeria aegeria TaxID=348720 RepID=A0A8S4SAT4_9NEOP|nr:jg6251 [Pararge aegeria aegeria]
MYVFCSRAPSSHSEASIPQRRSARVCPVPHHRRRRRGLGRLQGNPGARQDGQGSTVDNASHIAITWWPRDKSCRENFFEM